ncbi:hypothetical protein GGQ54_001064 [Naumannella cuiyingiana]|uniref:DUF1702 family protein n=1 Tax=Naumannella cuiyingiana TaxID=1347891 RepID=A0A7Z0IKD7_9ACTN|nr:DUF1702 family protein [Naumannella cuiyingiana]NYI70504.1 hypothetical protein [Naumannella cuiyingiana]
MASLGVILSPLYRVSPRHLPSATQQNQQRLTHVVDVVTACCQLALAAPSLTRLCRALDRYPSELRGFAYEGAGVGLAALDTLLPWRERTRRFVNEFAHAYKYAVYLGAGMGLARIGRFPDRFIRRLRDDVFGWVVWDGYGFHEGLFSYRRHVQERRVPTGVSGFALSVFDQGLGRAIWFGTGATSDIVAATIDAFPEPRRGDLWAGIGLASSYTGGAGVTDIARLLEFAGPHADRLAEGSAVAAKNRHDPANVGEHNERAVALLCGAPSSTISRMANDALSDLPSDGPEPAYAHWRERLRHTTEKRA